MNDRLDELLARLPGEPPAPDLAARIISSLAQYRRARTMWRISGGVALACAFVGMVLVAISWPEVANAFAATPTAPDANALAVAIDAFLTSPFETFTGLVNAALTWETALVEGVSVALMLGNVLLIVAVFGGMAQLLLRAAPLNSNSH